MEMASSMNLNGDSECNSIINTGMEIDNITYEDLSLFNHEEEFSVFHKLDFTRTRGGKDQLLDYFNRPHNKISIIYGTQQVLALIQQKLDRWPVSISNGTVMVMERFYETAIDTLPQAHNLPGALSYKVFHGPDYSMVRYSVGHFADFVRGMRQLISLFDGPECPHLLRELLQKAAKLLDHEVLDSLAKTPPGVRLNPIQVVYYGFFIRERFKTSLLSLIDIHNRLDAWYSMAMACRTYRFSFPAFVEQEDPYLEARSLYHILLPHPVSYDVKLDGVNNFLFLTGANMAGKSTFIRSVGVVVFLAHLGMGVPATDMRLSLFDGILSNINVVDNIAKGESFFFNEVQRIRNTILKINGRKKWLVLIDELFKGTNVQDAMKCSLTVIKGLIKIKNSLFILSTHLYEIGEELKQYPNISFRYFETNVKNDQLEFSYQLKEGISNDRIGYLILKREKVVEMLEKL